MSRYAAIAFVAIVWLLAIAVGFIADAGWALWIAAALFLLLLLGAWNFLQTSHSLARNYPLLWYIRKFFESVRPQIRQYFVESDTDGTPFDREQRSLVYQRAKNTTDTMPFGTERDVKQVGYEWINHSIQPVERSAEPPRIVVGNEQCRSPYSSSLLNISAMSFGSLGAAATRALNRGAKAGGFAHDTGEGGVSPYHLESGGDLIWEIGTGYFGCRKPTGDFDASRFRDCAADERIRMIQVKLSQGAKPGHGGLLPGRKVTPEIAAIRGVPVGVDCLSPPQHRAFQSPLGLMEFLAHLRELSGGKPVGFKLCIGHRWEFLALCKAMRQSGIYTDFIVIDGKEGGTGAAPVEFSDNVGTPRREGLLIAENALRGCGIRDKIKVGASGKIISGFDMAVTMAMGADWCNSARGFMFALGCLQSQKCHTNECPVGITTQDPLRERGLVVEHKARRVENFHRHTVNALLDLVAAVGLEHPARLSPDQILRRTSSQQTNSLADTYDWLEPRQLIDGGATHEWQRDWERASPDSFLPSADG
jgi:glutamate synthase domain-containing protein 2